jgi:retron-type reverse transcriptase
MNADIRKNPYPRYPLLIRAGFLKPSVVPKVSIKMYEANIMANLDSLMRELKDDTYLPKPLRRKFIPKGGGKFRPLGIPTVVS